MVTRPAKVKDLAEHGEPVEALSEEPAEKSLDDLVTRLPGVTEQFAATLQAHLRCSAR